MSILMPNRILWPFLHILWYKICPCSTLNNKSRICVSLRSIKIKEGTRKGGKKLKKVPATKLRRDTQKRKKTMRGTSLIWEVRVGYCPAFSRSNSLSQYNLGLTSRCHFVISTSISQPGWKIVLCNHCNHRWRVTPMDKNQGGLFLQ